MPATVTDCRALRDQAAAAHVISLIAQGTFELYSDLKVLVLGAGITWIPPVLWRFDTDAKALRGDAPWLNELPSEYFRRFFRVGTYPLERAATAAQLAKYLGSFRQIEDIVCFSSGYPDSDANSPAEVRSKLPIEWHEKVMATNAESLFALRTPPIADSHAADVSSKEKLERAE